MTNIGIGCENNGRTSASLHRRRTTVCECVGRQRAGAVRKDVRRAYAVMRRSPCSLDTDWMRDRRPPGMIVAPSGRPSLGAKATPEVWACELLHFFKLPPITTPQAILGRLKCWVRRDQYGIAPRPLRAMCATRFTSKPWLPGYGVFRSNIGHVMRKCLNALSGRWVTHYSGPQPASLRAEAITMSGRSRWM
jgi:hypothetical protein